MALSAKWGGVCAKCGGRYEPGDSILWDSDTRKASHETCPDNPSIAWSWAKTSDDKWAVRGPVGKPVPFEADVVKRDGTSQRVTLIEEVEPGLYKSAREKKSGRYSEKYVQRDVLLVDRRQRPQANRSSTVGDSGCTCGSTCCGGGKRCRCGRGCECRGGESYGCY